MNFPMVSFATRCRLHVDSRANRCDQKLNLPRGIFCPSPNPFHKHMFLTCAFLWILTNDGVCNEMLAPCGDARQQVRSKADFAHPCAESFVPSRKQDVSKCLAHVVCWPRWYDMLWPWLQPSGTKWNQVRIQATCLDFWPKPSPARLLL